MNSTSVVVLSDMAPDRMATLQGARGTGIQCGQVVCIQGWSEEAA